MLNCGNGEARDVSEGTYYLPIVLHKNITTGKEIKQSHYNDFSASPVHTISTTTTGVSSDYNEIIESGLTYRGVSKGNSKTAKTSPDTTNTSITTDENNLYVTFWYGPKEVINEATVNFQIVGKSTPEATQKVTFKTDTTSVDRNKYTANSTLISKGCTYVGWNKNDNGTISPSTGYSTRDSATVNDDTVLTFWYQPKATVKYQIVGKTSPEATSTVNVDAQGYNVEINRVYHDSVTNTKLTRDGYKYIGYVRNDSTYGRMPSSGYTQYDACHLKDPGTVLTFWYEEEAPVVETNDATVKFQIIGKSTPEATENVTFTSDSTSVNRNNYNVNNVLLSNDYTYAGWNRNDNGIIEPSSGYSTGDSSTVYDGSVLIFWYEKEEVPEIYDATVKFQIVGKSTPEATENVTFTTTSTNVNRNDYGANTRLIVNGYTYVGWNRNDNGRLEPSSGYSTGNSSTVYDGSVLTFWFEEAEKVNDVNIIYRTQTKILGTEEYSIKEGQKNDYYPKNPALFGAYEYVGYSKTLPTAIPLQNAPLAEGVTVEFDGNNHEIIFWYEQKINIRVIGVCKENNKPLYDTQKMTIVLPHNKTYQPRTFAEYTYANEYEKRNIITAYSGRGNNIQNGSSVKVEIAEGDTTQSEIFIIFYYNAKCKVNVTHKNIITNTVFSTGTEMISSEETPKNISSKANGSNLNYTVILDGVDIGSTYMENKQYTDSQYSVPIDYVLGKTYNLEFQYVSYDIKVNHYLYDSVTGNSTKIDTSEGFTLANGQIIANSITGGNYLNYSVNVKDNINNTSIVPTYKIGNTEVSEIEQYGSDKYKVVIDISTSAYTIDFYYAKQKLEVRHEWIDGGLIKPITKIDFPITNSPEPLENYTFIEYTLNGSTPKTELPVPNLMPDPIYKDKQILIFKYSPAPKIIEAETTLEPNDINNQLVNQNNNTKYWVLDNENHKLTIKVKAEKAEGTSITGYDVEVKMPFDVYVNGTLKPKNTLFKVSSTSTTVVIDKIMVPIWVDEIQYNNIIANVTVNCSYTAYDDAGNSIEKTDSDECEKTASVTVVGRVYDFSITNLEGDEEWRKSLFVTTTTDNGEHEADTLPIGQDNGYQSSRYSTGIMKGSQIYFSVNTKGSDNDTIVITPKFYYVKGNAGQVSEVIPVTLKDSKGNSLTNNVKIKLSRDSKYRETVEYKADREKAVAIYSDVDYGVKANINIGNVVDGLNLTETSKMPYARYISEFTSKVSLRPDGISDEILLKEASHWYGNYAIPNDVEAYNGNEKLKDGFIVVYFEISTQRDGNTYLIYNGDSPVSDIKESQWNYERADEDDVNYILPRKTVNQLTNKLKAMTWLKENGVSAVIYDTNISTKDNYTSVGTH